MREIKIRNRDDNNKYFLLNTRELKGNEIGELLKSFLEPNEKVIVIDDNGVKSSANQLLVLVRDENDKYLNVLSFENDSEFIY